MVWLTHERYAAAFLAETHRLGAVIADADPEAPVPACPKWTVRDLVTHVGTGHRWATRIVTERCEAPPPYVLHDAPGDPAAWADWLHSGARDLTGAIGDGGPDRPVWTWQPDGTAGFWLRKMLHDEVIHRFDAEAVAGVLGDVDPDVAVDGVSDWLATVATLSRPGVGTPGLQRLAGSGETLRFEATGTREGAWHVTRSPAGVVPAYGSGDADVTVRAPVRELLLLLNRRLDPAHDGVEVDGDRALFAYWLEHSRF